MAGSETKFTITQTISARQNGHNQTFEGQIGDVSITNHEGDINSNNNEKPSGILDAVGSLISGAIDAFSSGAQTDTTPASSATVADPEAAFKSFNV